MTFSPELDQRHFDGKDYVFHSYFFCPPFLDLRTSVDLVSIWYALRTETQQVPFPLLAKFWLVFVRIAQEPRHPPHQRGPWRGGKTNTRRSRPRATLVKSSCRCVLGGRVGDNPVLPAYATGEKTGRGGDVVFQFTYLVSHRAHTAPRCQSHFLFGVPQRT